MINIKSASPCFGGVQNESLLSFVHRLNKSAIPASVKAKQLEMFSSSRELHRFVRSCRPLSVSWQCRRNKIGLCVNLDVSSRVSVAKRHYTTFMQSSAITVLHFSVSIKKH